MTMILRQTFLIGIMLLAGIFAASEGHAVLLSTGDGTGNDAPTEGFSEYDYVGTLNGASATYLSNGWVITANHVGVGDVTFEDGVHTPVPGTAVRLETTPGGFADLLMFQVVPLVDLPPFPISNFSPSVNDVAIMVGNGRNRGPSTSFDPNGPALAPPLVWGWEWEIERTIRWGTNSISSFPPVPIFNTVSFLTEFDSVNPTVFEAQATPGDSGGAVYVFNPVAGQQLSGIMIGLSGAPGQGAGLSVFTNQTVIARLDFYRDQIIDVIEAPEPKGAFYAGLVLLTTLTRNKLGSNRSRNAS